MKSSRIEYRTNIDIHEDLYVSFNINNGIDENKGLVIYLKTVDGAIQRPLQNTTPLNYGLSLLSPVNDPQFTFDHIASVALDGLGGYGLKNTFKYAETGNDEIQKSSITTRINRDGIVADHSKTQIVQKLEEYKQFRVRFSGLLTKIQVDAFTSGEYINIFEDDIFIPVETYSQYVNVGFSFFGDSSISISDITYSFSS